MRRRCSGLQGWTSGDPVETAAAEHAARCRRALDALPAPPAPGAADVLAEAVAAAVRETLRRHAGALTTPTRSEALGLAERLKELNFNRRTRHPAPTAEDCRRVLRHRLAWAVSALSVPSRIPLAAGLFNYPARMDVDDVPDRLRRTFAALIADRSFGADYKYAQMALAGLLRVRGHQPWALMTARSARAREMAEVLEEGVTVLNAARLTLRSALKEGGAAATRSSLSLGPEQLAPQGTP